MHKKKLANAQTEREDARWFEENQDRLLKLFAKAEKKSALHIGSKSVGIILSRRTHSPKKPPSQKVMLRIPSGDLDRARRQATNAGFEAFIGRAPGLS